MKGIIFSVLMVVYCRYFMDFLFSWGPYTSTYVRYVKVSCVFKYFLSSYKTGGRILGRNPEKVLLFIVTCTVSTVQLLYTVKEKGGKNLIEMVFYQIFSSFLLPLLFRISLRNFKPENSQNYVHKPQRNCTFMNCSWIRLWQSILN